MKYICLGYMEKGKFEGMTEGEQQSTHGKAAIFSTTCSKVSLPHGTVSARPFSPHVHQPRRCRNSGCVRRKGMVVKVVYQPSSCPMPNGP